MAKNARFWVYWNGTDSKITLRPGESVHMARGYDNGEGWSHDAAEFKFGTDGNVYATDYHAGTDCDGRHESTSYSVASLSELAAIEHESEGTARWEERWPPVKTPNWRRDKPGRCYDQFAEMMNY